MQQQSGEGVGGTVRSVGRLVLAVAWAGLLAYGLHAQFAYATTAGSTGDTPAVFPPDSQLPRDTVLMFVHAECPCRRASLRELAQLLHGRGAVLVVAPATLGRWEDSLAAALARDIPNLRVFADDGSEVARFGAQTSGYVAFYDVGGAAVCRRHHRLTRPRGRTSRSRACGSGSRRMYGAPNTTPCTPVPWRASDERAANEGRPLSGPARKRAARHRPSSPCSSSTRAPCS